MFYYLQRGLLFIYAREDETKICQTIETDYFFDEAGWDEELN